MKENTVMRDPSNIEKMESMSWKFEGLLIAGNTIAPKKR
jgi:hypothetical protein